MADSAGLIDTIAANQSQKEVTANAAFDALSPAALYGRRATTSALLTWGYYGGRHSGGLIASGTLTLTASSTNYIVALRSTGAISVSTSATNWNNLAQYERQYLVVTDGTTATSWEDHRQAVRGNDIQCIPIACSDEGTDLTTGNAKVTFRMPYGYVLAEVRASVTVAPTGANIIADVNQNGASILSTKVSIDAGEKTSTTAATPAVIGDRTLDDDAEMTIDLDQIGSTIAGAGLKVYLIGVRA